MSLFAELALVFVAAGILATFLARFHQPSIVAYILAGAILGPVGFGLMRQNEVWTELSHLGVALLLFLVGLELNTSELKKYGKNAVAAGLAQVVITTVIGFFISLALGFALIPAIFISLAITFSSTILVVKILSEKRELQSLSGRLVIGIFLTQDLVALAVLILLSGSGHTNGNWEVLALTALKGILLVFLAWCIGKYVMERLLQRFGRSDELLMILALAWGLGFAALSASPLLDFSLEIGGFLAGIALARSSVHHQIGARVRSLRDFFLVLFFVTLGSGLIWDQVLNNITPAIWISIFILIGNPLIVLWVLGRLGYKPRTSFMAAITVGQTSEFSLILAVLGRSLGYLDDAAFGLMALVSVATMAVSAYMIIHSESLYNRLRPLLLSLPLWRSGTAENGHRVHLAKNHIVIVGAHQMGSRLANILHRKKIKFLVVDFNPETVDKLTRQGMDAICGDASDAAIQDLAGISNAKLIVSTLPQLQDNLLLAESLKNLKKRPRLIVASHIDADAGELYRAGFDYVVLPQQLSSFHLAHVISGSNIGHHLKQLRLKHGT